MYVMYQRQHPPTHLATHRRTYGQIRPPLLLRPPAGRQVRPQYLVVVPSGPSAAIRPTSNIRQAWQPGHRTIVVSSYPPGVPTYYHT